jgi:putative restriction endonuclease
VTAPADLPLNTRDDIPRVTALRSADVRARFSADVRAALTAEPALVARIAVQILERHFPDSLYQDILNAVGLTLESAKMKRTPAFRQRVLKAYEYRCAVCGFDVRLGRVSIALDAAHIRWHQAGGPDVESNGLALCVMHHKTFDLGAFTVENIPQTRRQSSITMCGSRNPLRALVSVKEQPRRKEAVLPRVGTVK